MTQSVSKYFFTRDGKSLVLRPLAIRDIGTALTFANSIVKERSENDELGLISFERKMTRKTEMEFLKGVVQGLRKRNVVSVAAFDDDVLVGNCNITRRKAADERHCGVLGIVISREHRGLGLGEEMIRRALRQASEWGVWLVELQVFSNNLSARRLYAKVGFREAGIIPGKILRGKKSFDEIQMYIDLRGTDKSASGAARGT